MPQKPTFYCVIADTDDEHNLSLVSLIEEAGLRHRICKTLNELKDTVDNTANIVFSFLSFDLIQDDNPDVLKYFQVAESDLAIMHTGATLIPATGTLGQSATYFFCKPLDTVFVSEILRDLVTELSALEKIENNPLDTCSLDQFGLLRGNSKVMRKLYRKLRKVAPSDASVLLVGESGTGKELAAQTIHDLSERWDKPFVAINCGAIPTELVESELFGHEKGSFSGADKKRIGYFEQAAGGTLLLDEIGEMPIDTQVKFLRVLESKKFRRIGGEQDIKSNVRIIAATNRDPAEAIKQNLLRKDLYFRIAQFPLYMPPLRNRTGDIVGLTQYFLNMLNEKNNTHKCLSESSRDRIVEYSWPGNVRELKSATERAYILAGEILESKHFPNEHMAFEDNDDYLQVRVGSTLEDTEEKLICATLESTDGDKKETAEQLGVSVKTLYNKLKSYEG